MNINPKLPQYFEKLKSDFQQLTNNPNPKNLQQVKGDLKQIMKEIDNLKM